MTLTEDAVRAVENHPWQGNIRELENCIKRATIMTDGNQISGDDLGFNNPLGDEMDHSLDLRQVRDNAEKRAILTALARVNGNMVKTTDLLGVSRPTLYDLMYRLGLKQ